MRILKIQPSDRARGAGIAGHWPPGCVADSGGAMTHTGYRQLRLVAAMGEDSPDDRQSGCDAIEAAAVAPRSTLQLAKEANPKGVLQSDARPCVGQRFLEHPWIGAKRRRPDMLGCLKALAQTIFSKRFYDLERVKDKSPSAEVDLRFDEWKDLTPELKASRPELGANVDFKGAPIEVMACGGRSGDQLLERVHPVPVAKTQTETAPIPAAAAG